MQCSCGSDTKSKTSREAGVPVLFFEECPKCGRVSDKRIPVRRIIYIPLNDEDRVVGEDHHNAKLSNDEVDQMRDYREETGMKYEDISTLMGVPLATVKKICTYKRRSSAATKHRRVITYV